MLTLRVVLDRAFCNITGCLLVFKAAIVAWVEGLGWRGNADGFTDTGAV